jgi:hypothetical protein
MCLLPIAIGITLACTQAAQAPVKKREIYFKPKYFSPFFQGEYPPKAEEGVIRDV